MSADDDWITLDGIVVAPDAPGPIKELRTRGKWCRLPDGTRGVSIFLFQPRGDLRRHAGRRCVVHTRSGRMASVILGELIERDYAPNEAVMYRVMRVESRGAWGRT